MRHIHRALLALQLTHALILTAAPRRRRHTPCKGTKLTSDYVESLFDGFADTFEGVLVEQLEYCAPAKVAEAAINATAHRGKYASALDAGCGTGLAGLELRDAVKGALDGVDLSSKMAEYAAELCATDDGKVERFRLVGPDEADGSRGEISVDAPLARALLGKRVDDEAWVRTPNGERCLYVNRIWYS